MARAPLARPTDAPPIAHDPAGIDTSAKVTPDDPAVAAPMAADELPRHVAIIMDGNRRWARQHELPEIEGVKYLSSQTDEVCAPGATGAKKPRIWAGTRPYGIGDYHIVVRADSAETHEILQAAFAAYRLPDDTPAPTNYSVVLGDHEGSSRGLNLVLEGNGVVVRTRSGQRAVYGLAAYLSRVLAPPAGKGFLQTYDRVGVIDGKAVILQIGRASCRERV